ncbi:hypothetical protein ACFLWG_01230 [Chloroflexota bacterium]
MRRLLIIIGVVVVLLVAYFIVSLFMTNEPTPAPPTTPTSEPAPIKPSVIKPAPNPESEPLPAKEPEPEPTPETETSITVISPNGGEEYYYPVSIDIIWETIDAGNSVKIELYNNDIYILSITNNTENDGHYVWVISNWEDIKDVNFEHAITIKEEKPDRGVSVQTTVYDYFIIKIADKYDSNIFDFGDNCFTLYRGSSGGDIF